MGEGKKNWWVKHPKGADKQTKRRSAQDKPKEQPKSLGTSGKEDQGETSWFTGGDPNPRYRRKAETGLEKDTANSVDKEEAAPWYTGGDPNPRYRQQPQPPQPRKSEAGVAKKPVEAGDGDDKDETPWFAGGDPNPRFRKKAGPSAPTEAPASVPIPTPTPAEIPPANAVQSPDIIEQGKGHSDTLVEFGHPANWHSQERTLSGGRRCDVAWDSSQRFFMMGHAYEGKGQDGVSVELLPDGKLGIVLADGCTGSEYVKPMVSVMIGEALNRMRTTDSLEEVRDAITSALQQPIPGVGMTFVQYAAQRDASLAKATQKVDVNNPDQMSKMWQLLGSRQKIKTYKTLAASTLVMATYDPRSGKLRAGVAGDSAIYVFRKATGAIEEKSLGAAEQYAIGEDGSVHQDLQVVEYDLASGDQFFIASDGFSREQMEKAIQSGKPTAHLFEVIQDGTAVKDDISVFGGMHA